MIKDLVPDSLWEQVEPLLPPRRPWRHHHLGRRPADDRAALAGIVLVLKTGISWNRLPQDLLGVSDTTCWRRLQDWTKAGVWPAVHELLLAQLCADGALDLERCSVDGAQARALKGWTMSDPARLSGAGPTPNTT